MAIVIPVISKIWSLVSWFDNLEKFLNSPLLPFLHFLIIICLILVVAYTLHTTRKEVSSNSHFYPKSTELGNTKAEHLVWVNKILSWFCSSSSIPQALETWIKDLNINIAAQKEGFDALIYGLREGTVLPSLIEIKSVETIGDNINAKILLRTTEFGFMVTVKESMTVNGKHSSNYSAVVTYFECWFSLILTQIEGKIDIILKPTETKPSFNINMKPLSPVSNDSQLKPEVISLAIQEAVLNTSFYIKINVVTTISSNCNLSDSEKNSTKLSDNKKKPESASSAPLQLPVSQTVKYHPSQSASVPGTPRRVTLNILPQLSNQTTSVSGSIGSLSSITRTPSGHGPAKPIRVREKRLIINNLKFNPSTDDSFFPIDCLVELDHPHQSKSTELRNDFPNKTKLNFDLSSRSSKLKLILQSSTDSKDSLHLKTTLFIDGVIMEKTTPISIPLKHEEVQVGTLELEMIVISGPGSVKQRRPRKKSKSSPAVSTLGEKKSPKKLPASSFEKESRDLNNDEFGTKITRVTTVSRSPSGSPIKQSNDIADNENEGISFNSTSVAETVLKDLSTKNSPVRKAKILITAVEKQNSDVNHSQSDVSNSQSDEDFTCAEPDSQSEVDSHSLCAPPLVSVVPPTPTETNFKNEELIHDSANSPDDTPSKSTNLRRTQSLNTKSSKKSKQKQRASVTGSDEPTLPPIKSHSSVRSLNRKSSFSKLFSRKKKEKKMEESLIEESEISSNVGGESLKPSSGTPVKIKRSRSFKDIMKGKKKSPKLKK